ncbi:hypothetical protein C1I64_07440 [Rathayibacter festucae DSM 15932]|uniref:Uncharacterized protein n=1 Tax=Rathayibacter festucae DSM 15932 TaxID=1328866 RepID=A0A3Q9UQS0_9MICO|nr:hypothetical protein C1I64_07440 [Rathayibacter festucae DSM 15932]
MESYDPIVEARPCWCIWIEFLHETFQRRAGKSSARSAGNGDDIASFSVKGRRALRHVWMGVLDVARGAHWIHHGVVAPDCRAVTVVTQ